MTKITHIHVHTFFFDKVIRFYLLKIYLPGDKPLAEQTVTAPSAVKYRPVIFGSANVAMNEPSASNAAIRTYRMMNGNFNPTPATTHFPNLLD